MKSIFTDQAVMPDASMLENALAENFVNWQKIYHFAKTIVPKSTEHWKFNGKKFGWSFRLNDQKRVVMYFLPRDGFFKVAFVFGQKAYDEVIASDVSQEIKDELMSAKPYAEGRGIRIEIRDERALEDIFTLATIKTKN